jgi:hypothetical protein
VGGNLHSWCEPAKYVLDNILQPKDLLYCGWKKIVEPEPEPGPKFEQH